MLWEATRKCRSGNLETRDPTGHQGGDLFRRDQEPCTPTGDDKTFGATIKICGAYHAKEVGPCSKEKDKGHYLKDSNIEQRKCTVLQLN